jgi:hypothetical protein
MRYVVAWVRSQNLLTLVTAVTLALNALLNRNYQRAHLFTTSVVKEIAYGELRQVSFAVGNSHASWT